MTESKHTSLPWVLEEGEYGQLTKVGIPFVDAPGNPGSEALDGSEGEYLWLETSDGEYLGQHRDAEANARLIFAASDLLSALQALMSSLGNTRPEHLQQARAAITKATGVDPDAE